MLDWLVPQIEAAVALAPVWGFALIFFFMAVESSFIPFPSEVVMIPAGFLAARGELTSGNPALDLFFSIVAGLAGCMAGAFFNYWIAASLGTPFLRRWGKWFFLKPEALDRACELFNKYGDMATFLCRLVPVVRQLISLPAGVAGMPLKRFAFFTGLGAGIWTAVLAVIGWTLGRSSKDLSWSELIAKGKETVQSDLLWIILGAILLASLYVLASKAVMRRSPGKKH